MKKYKPTEAFELLDDEALSKRKLELGETLAVLRQQAAALNGQVMQHFTDEQRIVEIMDRRALAARGSDHDWAALLKENGYGSSAMLKAAQEAIGSLANRGYHEGLATSGYNPKTEQRVLRVALLRGAPELTRKVHDALLMLLPYVHPAATDELEGTQSYRYVSVVDAALSASGSYALAINEASGLYAVVLRQSGRLSVQTRRESLKELLDYVEQHLAYEDAGRESIA